MCIKYALLGFYLCHFRKHESIKRFNSVQLKTYQIKKYISCSTYNNPKFVAKRIGINCKK